MLSVLDEGRPENPGWYRDDYHLQSCPARGRKKTWCLTSTETIKLIRDREKRGKVVWRWGKKQKKLTHHS